MNAILGPASSHGRGQRSKRSQAARAQMASKMSAGVRVKKKVQSGRPLIPEYWSCCGFVTIIVLTSFRELPKALPED